MKFNTPWQTCTHPLDRQDKLRPLPTDDEWWEHSGEAYQQYDCLACGSMKTEYLDNQGRTTHGFGWQPPEDGDGVLP